MFTVFSSPNQSNLTFFTYYKTGSGMVLRGPIAQPLAESPAGSGLYLPTEIYAGTMFGDYVVVLKNAIPITALVIEPSLGEVLEILQADVKIENVDGILIKRWYRKWTQDIIMQKACNNVEGTPMTNTESVLGQLIDPGD